MEVLAFISPDNQICIDTTLADENSVWRVFLGWPDQEEINDAKLRGYRVVKAEIIIKEELK